MDQIIELARHYVSFNLLHKGLEMIGVLTLVSQIVPKLLAWGIPASLRGADYVSGLLLNSPMKPLIIWKADAIVNFLNDFSHAVEQITETFSNRLEENIKTAAAATADSALKTASSAAATSQAANETAATAVKAAESEPEVKK